MGRIRLDSVSDFSKHGYDLDVRCRSCGHVVVLTPEWFFKRGILGSIAKLERRFRCAKCKARAAAITATAFGPSGGKRKGADWRDGLRRARRGCDNA